MGVDRGDEARRKVHQGDELLPVGARATADQTVTELAGHQASVRSLPGAPEVGPRGLVPEHPARAAADRRGGMGNGERSGGAQRCAGQLICGAARIRRTAAVRGAVRGGRYTSAHAGRGQAGRWAVRPAWPDRGNGPADRSTSWVWNISHHVTAAESWPYTPAQAQPTRPTGWVALCPPATCCSGVWQQIRSAAPCLACAR